ncbi:hypothetical protein ACFQL4_19850 [Halosimplex aquaticum]
MDEGLLRGSCVEQTTKSAPASASSISRWASNVHSPGTPGRSITSLASSAFSTAPS